MARYENVLDGLHRQGVIVVNDDGEVSLDIHGDHVTRQELVRLAQHLLEAAGAPLPAVVAALRAIWDDDPDGMTE